MKPQLDFEKYQKEGRLISILVDNPLPAHIGEGKESYVGCIHSFDDNFLVLNTPTTNKRICGIAIRWEMILSIWIYHDKIS